jgi:hypothetical protein
MSQNLSASHPDVVDMKMVMDLATMIVGTFSQPQMGRMGKMEVIRI